MLISPQAIIDSSAIIAADVLIGPWTVIGPNVTIGAGTKIGPHVVIKENTVIGNNNIIHPFASLGGDPQVKDYQQQQSYLEIGDENTFHEYVTVSRGDVSGNSITKIGNKNLFMACAHIAHDCDVANSCIFVNNSALAGHVTISDYVVVGGYCAVHQFCSIGGHSFLSRGAMVTQDVLPYMMVAGNPPVVSGINKVGLSRRGFSKELIAAIFKCYKIIFRSNLTVVEAIKAIEAMPTHFVEIDAMKSMLLQSTRGVVR